MVNRANGHRANDHRANGNRADVVAPDSQSSGQGKSIEDTFDTVAECHVEEEFIDHLIPSLYS